MAIGISIIGTEDHAVNGHRTYSPAISPAISERSSMEASNVSLLIDVNVLERHSFSLCVDDVFSRCFSVSFASCCSLVEWSDSISLPVDGKVREENGISRMSASETI